MVLRRCPQCRTTTDDMYGFCIKCGYEFPKIENEMNACPYCGYPNHDDAEFCVKCGTPLIFKSQFEGDNTAIKPIIITRESINNMPRHDNTPRTSRILILLGYVFSVLGGLIGLIIAIYLATRKDPVAKKHGRIQLCIFAFYVIIISVMFATGNIPPETIATYKQILQGNITLENLTHI